MTVHAETAEGLVSEFAALLMLLEVVSKLEETGIDHPAFQRWLLATAELAEALS